MGKKISLQAKSSERISHEGDVIDYSWNGQAKSHFFGDDVWLTNTWLPNDKTGGMPSEIIYCPEINKFYVYCTSNLMVLDGTTRNILSKIFVSERATMDESGIGWNASYYCEKKMEYNPGTKSLFIATEDEKLKIIDCALDNVIETFDHDERFENLICEIYYNPVSEIGSWLTSGYHTKAILKTIDGRNNVMLNERKFPDVTLYKIAGDKNGGRIFVSGEKDGPLAGKYVWILNESTLETIAEIPVPYAFVNMIFHPDFNKLYLAPFQSAPTGIVGVINCEPGLYAYIRNIVVHGLPKRMTMNPNHHRIFVCGGWGEGKISIIDGTNDTETAFADIESPNSLYFSETMDAVFCGGKNRVIMITGNSNFISAQSPDNLGGTSFSFAMQESTKTLVSANPAAGHITIFNCSIPDPLITLDGYRQLGASTYFGCYNSVNKKYYFIQNDSSSIKSFVNIYDAITQTRNNTLTLAGASMLSSCAYNERYNKIFISAYGSNKIYVISGDDDFRINAVISDLEEPKKIYDILDWGMIACGGKEKIYLIGAKDNKILTKIKIPGETFVTDFIKGNLYPDVIFAGCFTTKQIIKINVRNFTIEGSISLPGSPATRPIYLCYHPHHRYIIAVSNPSIAKSRVVIIDEATLGVRDLLDLDPWSYEPVYNPYTRSIYILNRGSIWADKFGGLIELKMENGSFITKKITIKGLHSNGLVFNPHNNRMYLHTYYDPFTAEKESSFVAVDCTENIVKSIGYLGQKQNFGENAAIYSYDEGMVFIPDNDRLVIGNRGFSNLSIVQCYQEQLSLSEGWNWISFPRMERYGIEPSPTVEALSKLSCLPETGVELYNQENGFKFWNSEENKWEGTLDEIQSVSGYKLFIGKTNEQIPTLQLFGARIHPQTEMTVTPHIETWIGYFSEFPQYPWQAFPEWFYNGSLSMIKSQYWTMIKLMGKWKISGKVVPLKYGDMVIVKTNSTEPVTFTWNKSSIPEPLPVISKPVKYTWEEKPDYIPVYIEIPEQSDVIEVALKVSGKCIGAAVRKPGEKLIEVDACITGLPDGTEISFETWNGIEFAILSKRDYRLIRRDKHRVDENILVTDEKTEFYEVIFNK